MTRVILSATMPFDLAIKHGKLCFFSRSPLQKRKSHHGSIFFQESAAIEAFAVSWLAKGEAHLSLARAA
jgi:hypothetical protein